MEKTSYEDSESQRETKIIRIDQTIILGKALVNLISQQVMTKHPNHDYANSQLLDYGIDKSMMLKQNSINLMIQHGSKGIYSVHITRSLDLGMSSKLFSATSIKFFGQQVFIVAHVEVSINLSGRQQE